MADTLTIDQLKKEYHIASTEGKKWLSVVNHEKEYTLNSIATIHMNACSQIKERILRQIGLIIVQEK